MNVIHITPLKRLVTSMYIGNLMQYLARIVAPAAMKLFIGAAMIAAVISVSSRAAHAQLPGAVINSYSVSYSRGSNDTLSLSSSGSWNGSFQLHSYATWKCTYGSQGRNDPAPPPSIVLVSAGSATVQSPASTLTNSWYFAGTAQGTTSKPSNVYDMANYKYRFGAEVQDLQGTPKPDIYNVEVETSNSLSIIP